MALTGAIPDLKNVPTTSVLRRHLMTRLKCNCFVRMGKTIWQHEMFQAWFGSEPSRRFPVSRDGEGPKLSFAYIFVSCFFSSDWHPVIAFILLSWSCFLQFCGSYSSSRWNTRARSKRSNWFVQSAIQSRRAARNCPSSASLDCWAMNMNVSNRVRMIDSSSGDGTPEFYFKRWVNWTGILILVSIRWWKQ